MQTILGNQRVLRICTPCFSAIRRHKRHTLIPWCLSMPDVSSIRSDVDHAILANDICAECVLPLPRCSVVVTAEDGAQAPSNSHKAFAHRVFKHLRFTRILPTGLQQWNTLDPVDRLGIRCRPENEQRNDDSKTIHTHLLRTLSSRAISCPNYTTALPFTKHIVFNEKRSVRYRVQVRCVRTHRVCACRPLESYSTDPIHRRYVSLPEPRRSLVGHATTELSQSFPRSSLASIRHCPRRSQ